MREVSTNKPRIQKKSIAVAFGAVAILAVVHITSRARVGAAAGDDSAGGRTSAAAAKPALTVTLTTPQTAEWAQALAATGNIAAWQEAAISTEISNFRLTEVTADVGDRVRKGQLLARIASGTVAAELAQSQAAVAEAQATLAEARANARRARDLQSTGAMSEQQIRQYLTAERAARARLDVAQARVQGDRVRLAQTRVLAPDDGIISARTATVGSLAQSGQELFRMILGSRLEWRAEVPEAALGRLAPGTPAKLSAPDGTAVSGRVRVVAPTVDPQTRNGLVYVDLPPAASGKPVRAGMFARGEFELGRTTALTLPQSAVLLRDGFAYVFRLDDADKVVQAKIKTGRRSGDRIEITEGLDANARVVASGVGFLADGDSVRLVDDSATDQAGRR